LIQVVDSKDFGNGIEEESKEEKISSQIESPFQVNNYGFTNKYNDVFDNKEDVLLEVADINPKEVPRN
jgi:hypothetical protein